MTYNFKVNNFDLIRLLAASQVLLVHSIEHLHIPVSGLFWNVLAAFPGVPIFFVISGYLISASYDKSNSLSSYARNRVLRIFPGLWFCFLLGLLIIFLVFRAEFSPAEFLLWSAAQLSFFQFYNPDFLREFGVGVLNGSLWTIPIELQFYFLMPFFLLGFDRFFSRRKGLAWLLVLAAGTSVAVASRFLLSGVDDRLVKLFGVSLIPHFYLFCVGIFWQRHQELVAKFISGRFVAWLLLYVACYFASRELGWDVRGNSMNPALASILACLVLSAAYSAADKLSRCLRGIDISYGIYIYHMLIINVFVYYGLTGNAATIFSCYVLAVVVSLFSWFVIERPALRLKASSVH